MTSSVKKALRKTGALHLIHRVTARGRVDIMLYHGFRDGSAGDAAPSRFIPIQQFEEQIRLFLRYSRPVRLEDIGGGATSGVAVTIDDGYGNNYDLAFPLLTKYQFPATIFVTTGFIDRKVPLPGDWLEFLLKTSAPQNSVFEWRDQTIELPLAARERLEGVTTRLKARMRKLPIDEANGFLRALEAHLEVGFDWNRLPDPLRPLRWSEVRAMHRSGLVSFGSHTVSHAVLSYCSESIQRFEVEHSKRRLEEELGTACGMFAYPYGKAEDYTASTRRIVQNAGYTLGVSAESGFNGPSIDPYDLRRWGANIGADDLLFLIAGGPSMLRTLKLSFGT